MPSKSKDHAALGAAFRSLRNAAGWTLEDLAERVPGGMNPRYVSAIERGEINVSFANLLRLCEGLGVKLSDVVARYEDDRS